MKEIEIKILNINLQEVEKKLLKVGAQKIGTYIIHDEFYDFADNHIKKSDEVLRLRTMGKRFLLTYKGSRRRDSQFKVREEAETEVSDAIEMKSIFKMCGLSLKRTIEKKRISYERNEVKIEIDSYPGIPPYLEIESTDKNAIEKLVSDIGYTMKQTTSKSIRSVLANYGLDKS